MENEFVICAACKSKNTQGSIFCNRCGTRFVYQQQIKQKDSQKIIQKKVISPTGLMGVFIVVFIIIFMISSKPNEKTSINISPTPIKTNTIIKATSDIPEYTILYYGELISGGNFADILIISYSPKTPVLEIRTTLRRILQAQNLVVVNAYSTQEAYRADMSEIFRKSHPDAYKGGYLGAILEDGAFYGPDGVS